MGRRGRPVGSGYDDTGRIACVRLAMARGLSRRAAILVTCGHDQLRRIEIKMRMADMSEQRGRHVARVIQATLVGMGRRDGEVVVIPVKSRRADGSAWSTMVEEAHRLGFTLLPRSGVAASPDQP